MAEFERGRVRRIILEFEYPDGSVKTLDVDAPSKVSMIAFDEHWIPEDDRKLFNLSDRDWRQNPSVLMYPVGPSFLPATPYCMHCSPPPSVLDLIWPKMP
jgi:hypothetical protein